MRRGGLLFAVLLGLLATAPGLRAETLKPLTFAELDGWAADDHHAALVTFRSTCGEMGGADWAAACAAAQGLTGAGEAEARGFFEAHFRPVWIGPQKQTLFTGYYEPELVASPVRTPRFAYPIYRKPPELVPGRLWYDRAEIVTRGLLQGRGLELAWLEDPVDVFFLQIQGSGRLKMPDGHVMRVGFAAKNGQPYRSIGMELVQRGEMTRARASAQGIRAWVRENPEAGQQLFLTNPSFVFFRPIAVPAEKGPLGAMQYPVTPGRTLAVDPKVVPLGAPVWIETGGHAPLRRLLVAQDIGTAIKGPWRADVFMGAGAKAGSIAGRMRDRGRMVVLLPLPAGAVPATVTAGAEAPLRETAAEPAPERER